MSTSNSMILAQAVKRAAAVVTTLKNTYNDGANAVLLYAGGSNGSVLRKLSAIPRGTVTATQLQLYAYDGTNYWFVTTTLMVAATITQTTILSPSDFGYTDTNTLYVPPGWSLYVGIGVALSAGIVFNAELADF